MKVDQIWQVVRLKQVVQRWRSMTLLRRRRRRHRSSSSHTDSDSKPDPDSSVLSGSTCRHIPSSGFLAVYVGTERKRFVIPTRYLNLPVFLSLLDEAEEEFGFQNTGGLVLLCDVGFFTRVLKFLERDEQRFGGFELEQFSKLVSDDVVGLFDSSRCKETTTITTTITKACREFKPLLKKARV